MSLCTGRPVVLYRSEIAQVPVNQNFCAFLTHKLQEVNDSVLTKRRIRDLEVALYVNDTEHGCEGEMTNLLRNHNKLW